LEAKALSNLQVILITGTSRGIGKYLAHYYAEKGLRVIGCSRNTVDYNINNYHHFCLDITNESQIKNMFSELRKSYKRLDVLINNVGIMSTNHVILTPLKTAQDILNTNVAGTFLLCREAAKIMQKNKFGRIVNFTSVSSRLKTEGEAIYAASKSAIITLSQIIAKELATYNITVNVVGPNPISTDIIASLPQKKINDVIGQQAIRRWGEFKDVSNVIDFFIQSESDFVTGQVIFLGGI
jgi:3-oxoacyl-[acyl-carrier protein] reductase